MPAQAWVLELNERFRYPKGPYQPAREGHEVEWAVWAVQQSLNNRHWRQYATAILLEANKGYLDAQTREERDGVVTIRWTGRGNEEIVRASEVVSMTLRTEPPADIPPAGDNDIPPAPAGLPPEEPGSENEDLFKDSDEVEDPEDDVAHEPQPQDGADPQEDAEPQDNKEWGRDRPPTEDIPLGWGRPRPAFEDLLSDPEDVTLEDLERAQRHRVEVGTVRSVTVATAEARRSSSAASEQSVCAARANTLALRHFAEAANRLSEAASAVSIGTAAASTAARAASSAERQAAIANGCLQDVRRERSGMPRSVEASRRSSFCS